MGWLASIFTFVCIAAGAGLRSHQHNARPPLLTQGSAAQAPLLPKGMTLAPCEPVSDLLMHLYPRSKPLQLINSLAKSSPTDQDGQRSFCMSARLLMRTVVIQHITQQVPVMHILHRHVTDNLQRCPHANMRPEQCPICSPCFATSNLPWKSQAHFVAHWGLCSKACVLDKF